jgi:nucleotide-binding universal stress UspA family protein
MKKILVPCDFSEPSIQAFKFALEIAGKSNGQVILLHIVEVPVMHDTMINPVMDFEISFFKDMKDRADRHFEKIKRKWGKENIKIHSTVKLGGILSTIERFSEETKVDLIVMGTHGVSGVKEFFVGSNTQKVVRFSSVPVIAIKQSIKLSRIKNIVFPIALHENRYTLIRQIKKLQSLFSATLHLLIINTPGNLRRTADEKQLMEEYAKNYKLIDYTLNIRNDFSEKDGIISFASETKADMIAMGTHGREGLAHFLMGSIAESVVNHISCPVWTYIEK